MADTRPERLAEFRKQLDDMQKEVYRLHQQDHFRWLPTLYRILELALELLQDEIPKGKP